MAFISRDTFRWNYLWLTLFAAGMAIYLIVMPMYYDDLWYLEYTWWWFDMQGIVDPTNGGNVFSYGIPWEDLGHTISERFANDTARVCNMVGPFMLFFPKWISSTIAFLVLMYGIWACFKLSDIDLRRSWLVGIGIGLWTLTPLWYDGMSTVIYQYNYLVSTGIGMGLIVAVNKRSRKLSGLILLILLSILAAVWHEGFTVPLLIAFLVVTVFFKSCRDRWHIIAIAILLAGAIWHFAGTSTLMRMHSGYKAVSIKHFLISLYHHRAVWIAIVISIIFWIKKGFRPYISDPQVIFMLAGIIVSLGQSYYSNIERAAWWGDVMAIWMSLYLLRKLDVETRGYKGWRGWTACFIIALSYLQLIAADIFIIRFSREYPRLIARYLDEPKQTQFTELIDYPWIGLPFMQMTPDPIYLRIGFEQMIYWGLEDKEQQFLLVPEGLKSFTPEKAERLEGNSGFMKFGPYMVAESDSTSKYLMKHNDIDYGWFQAQDRMLDCVPFISEIDGKRYVYIFPVFNQTEYHLGNIKSVNVRQ